MKTAQLTIQSSKFKVKSYSLKFKVVKFIYFALLITTLHFALYTLHLSEAIAQTTTRSFTISPPSLKLKLNPGQKTEKIIKITNNSSETLTFIADVKDFIVTNNSGTPELLAAGINVDNRFSAASWTTVLPDQLVIEPGRSATTTLYLQIPGNARPGGRYVSVTFRPTTNPALSSSGAAINTVVGSLVYLTVNGPTKEGAKVQRFAAPPFSEYGPIDLATEIKNEGDIHINPRGTVVVTDLVGRNIYSGVLENLNIFPGTSRTFSNSIETKLLFGRFVAKMDGYYGSKNFPLVATIAFWVIPYKLIAGIIIVAILIMIAVNSIQKKQEQDLEVKEEPQQN